jgi:ubiquitin-conjugating enzyme E2 J2
MPPPSLTIKRLQKELQMMEKNPVPNIVAVPQEDNILRWHFCIYGLDAPYQGGFYHGYIDFPGDYPFKPPSMIFVTPSGRFKVGEKICMSFTSFHPESWCSSWSIDKMLLGLISFMYENEVTAGGITSTPEAKQKLAAASAMSNATRPEFMKVFKEHLEKMGFKAALAVKDLPRSVAKPQPQAEGSPALVETPLRADTPAPRRWLLPVAVACMAILYVALKKMDIF